MTADPNRFDLLEMDSGPRVVVPDEVATLDIDMVDTKNPRCHECGERTVVNRDGVCRACHEEFNPPQDAFAGLAANSRSNANAANLGDVARGRASLGVGFTSADGYLEALRRGVGRVTVESYASTLRSTYKIATAITYRASGVLGSQTAASYTVEVRYPDDRRETFTAPLMDVVAGTGESVDSHANDAAIAVFKAGSAARQAAIAKVKADQAAQTTLASAPVVEDVAPVRIRHGEVVAGAVAEGHGVLVGWTGKGPKTHAQLTELAIAAQIPADAMPKPREVSTHARRAVQAFAGGGLTFYTEDRGRKWRLERPAQNAKPGERSGDVALVVTLVGEAMLECEGDETLSVQVRAQFDRLVADQVHDAADISHWLVVDVLRGCLNAVKYGGNWYVARRYRAVAESITTAFDGQWGADWMNPALPIATTAQLAQGLANGLAREIDAIVGDIETARSEAQARGKEDIGETKATNEMIRLRKAGERVVAYASLLGDKLVAECREKVRKSMAELDALVDGGIVARFGHIWEEIEMDVKRSGGAL